MPLALTGAFVVVDGMANCFLSGYPLRVTELSRDLGRSLGALRGLGLEYTMEAVAAVEHVHEP